MNRRRLLQLAGAGVVHAITVAGTTVGATIQHRIGCAVRSDRLPQYLPEFMSLPIIDIEDWLDPTFPERASTAVPVVQQALAGYHGRILLSGPFIDLNPGSSERLIQPSGFRSRPFPRICP
jgi:hypothetical protein